VAGNLLLSLDTRFPVNCHIGLLFGERLDTLFTSSDSKISGLTFPHVIGFVVRNVKKSYGRIAIFVLPS